MDSPLESLDLDRESHEISEKIHTVDGSSSSSSGGDADEEETAPPSYGKVENLRGGLFTREPSVRRPSDAENRAFGDPSSLSVNLFTWKDNNLYVVLLGIATAVLVLIELLEYHLVTLICHLIIFAFAMTFLYSNSAIILNKKPPHFPEASLSHEPFVDVAMDLCNGINDAISYLREIASVRDLKKFLKVIAVLWVISVVGSLCSFLMLSYLLFVFHYVIPALYEKCADNIKEFTEQAHLMNKKLQNMFHANVVRKISICIKKEKQT